MRVLITGGTGTISSGLVRECVNKGYETYALTRGSNSTRNIIGAKYLHANIWNAKEVGEVLDELEFDIVVECLVFSVDQLEISLNSFADRCKRYIFISTAAIYDRQGGKRVKESDGKNFVKWTYTKNKIECEKHLKEFCNNTGLEYTIVRPTVTYGDYRIPFPIATRNPGWTFFQRMIDGKPMLAGNNVVFSIIHIEDFSKSVVSLFENNKAINEDFHITSNKNDIYWDDVILEAGKILGIVPKIVHVPVDVIREIWPGIYDEMNCHKNTTQIFDDAKIKTVTGVEAVVGLNEGMKRIICSMKSEVEKRNLKLDGKWNDYCNATMYYAFKKGRLSQQDREIVEDYINKAGRCEFKLSCKRIKWYKMKDVLYGIKVKIEKRIKMLERRIYG